MPIIGNNIAQSVAGAASAERAAAKPADKRPVVRAQKRRGEDELVTTAGDVDMDGLRSLKSNDQEESHEDHEQQGAYTPRGKKAAGDASPKLDVAG